FVHVLGGEGPIDHLQRKELASGRELHPLLRSIVRIHVTEEARHVGFAQLFLEERVPRLSSWRALRVRWSAPVIVSDTARIMMVPAAPLLREHAVPRDVARAAYGGDLQRARILAGVAGFRAVATRLGLITR